MPGSLLGARSWAQPLFSWSSPSVGGCYIIHTSANRCGSGRWNDKAQLGRCGRRQPALDKMVRGGFFAEGTFELKTKLSLSSQLFNCLGTRYPRLRKLQRQRDGNILASARDKRARVAAAEWCREGGEAEVNRWMEIWWCRYLAQEWALV